ncbi:uncharacterized protein LOC129309021 [Prosopis cineraria]|uniref:uncharacterized protein LOC129309021 n=1 Tax=Prosopis cineraria TaxID=364024 RepID=UPI00240FFF34|nr:uncharacterized protein LOC129309021 [Prosopis cineraria]
MVRWSSLNLIDEGRVRSQGKWRALKIGTIKINIDRACGRDGVVAGCGGIVRDHAGKTMGGFLYHISQRVNLLWCGHDANTVANKLAKEALDLADGPISFIDLPKCIYELLAADLRA